MRLVGSYDGKAQAATIAAESNCHTDSFPLVDRVILYNVEFDLGSPAFALAATLLFRDYCGEAIEFNGPKITLEMLDAVRRLVPHAASIGSIDAMKRDNFGGGIDVYCTESGVAQPRVIEPTPLTVQVNSFDWSGDFPGTDGRPPNLQRGAIFTNAMLVARSSTVVSIAIGLLAGGTKLSRLHVPAPADFPDAAVITTALAAVGVQLKLLPL